MNKRSEEIQKSLSNLSTFVQEAFSGIRVLKAFAREDDSAKRFTAESDVYKSKSLAKAINSPSSLKGIITAKTPFSDSKMCAASIKSSKGKAS